MEEGGIINDDDPKQIVADVIGDVKHLEEVVDDTTMGDSSREILTAQLFLVKQKLTALQEILSGAKP